MDREFRALIGLSIVLAIFHTVMWIHELRVNKDSDEYKAFLKKPFTRFHFRSSYRSWRYFTDVYLKSPNPNSEQRNDNQHKHPDSYDDHSTPYR